MVKPKRPNPKQNSVTVNTTLVMAKMSGNFEGVLSENMGSSHTNIYEENTISTPRKASPQIGVFHATSKMGELAMPTMSKALAGVGMPIKE